LNERAELTSVAVLARHGRTCCGHSRLCFGPA
jgi:hypothetical protein